MLQLIDAVALWWLNWRYDRKIKSFSAAHPEYGFELKRAVVAEDGMYIDGTSPAIAYLAAEAAKMLDRANASNYTQFDLVPHIASELRAVRVTVQWANGMSPAMRAERLNEFVLAYDAWAQSRCWCAGPQFDDVVKARESINDLVRKAEEAGDDPS